MTRPNLALGLLLACSGKGSDDGSDVPGGTPGGSPVGGSGTPAGSATGAGTGPPPTSVVGLLVDPAGAPLSAVDVLCCTEATCIQLESEADGTFSFDLDPGTRVSLKTHSDIFRIPRWGSALAPVLVPESGGFDVGTLYVPDLPAGQVLGPAGSDPQTVAAGDGLTLTLNRGDLTPEFGVVLNDVAARALPDTYWPIYEDLAGREVQAVYAVHPFGTTSASPIAVRAPTALPAGTAVSVWAVYHLGGALLGPVPGTSDGAFVQTNPGTGIELMTHVVITAP